MNTFSGTGAGLLSLFFFDAISGGGTSWQEKVSKPHAFEESTNFRRWASDLLEGSDDLGELVKKNLLYRLALKKDSLLVIQLNGVLGLERFDLLPLLLNHSQSLWLQASVTARCKQSFGQQHEGQRHMERARIPRNKTGMRK